MKNCNIQPSNENNLDTKQQNLQFKTIRKRTIKKQSRSKSTLTSLYDKYQQTYFQQNVVKNEHCRNEDQNNIYGLKCENFQDLTEGYHNQGRGNRKNGHQNIHEDQYTRRSKIQKDRQFLSKCVSQKENLSTQCNKSYPKKQSFFPKKSNDTNNLNKNVKNEGSSNTISYWRPVYSTSPYYQPNLHQLQNKNNLNHFRNKSESVNLTRCYSNQNLQKDYNRFHNFRKNKIINRLISINTEANKQNYHNKLTIDQFQMGLCFKQDFIGRLYPARHIATGFILCIKQIIKSQVNHDLDKLIQRLKLQVLINSQYIIQIYGIFEEKDKIYVLMQYNCEGNLYYKLKNNKKFYQKDALTYFFNICNAIRDLHNTNIVYRNLKPQNISLFQVSLYQMQNICKISNLSWSSHIDQQKYKYIGAIQYCAPQLLEGQQYTKQCDIWAIGVLFYQLIVGVTPFHNFNSKKTKQMILHGQFNLQKVQNIYIQELLCKIFQKNACLRPTITNLIQQIQQILQQQNYI